MGKPTVPELAAAVRACWDIATCSPDDVPFWHKDNPSRGQCNATVLVVHDLLGGELVETDAYRDGERVGVHYSNRLPDGEDLDLTFEQFGPDEHIADPRVVQRPPQPPSWARHQYELLRSRVLVRLGGFALAELHHVQLAIPAGGEQRCREFWGGVLGMDELAKPPEPAKRGGCWFRGGGVEVHLGVERDFRPSAKAHPAISVRGIRTLAARLEDAGTEITWDDDFPGHDRFYAADPFGNRLEFLEPRV